MSETQCGTRLSHWMEDLANYISSYPLHEIALPGSHNSGAYALSSDAAPGTPSVYRFIPGFVKRWSICQEHSVYDQLRCGARYLDLRTARTGESAAGSSDELCLKVVHGLVGVGTLEVLQQVRKFLDETTLEVVVVDFQHFYGLSADDHVRLAVEIERIFGAHAITKLEAAAPLSDLWARHRRVLFLYGNTAFASTRPNFLVERTLAISSPWAGDGHTRDAVALKSFRAALEAYMSSYMVGVRTPEVHLYI